ncbi:MAG: HAD-IA family hydrolase [Defluviicoccus sp.]
MSIAVVFDVDGVLVDSPHERAWREALTRLVEGEWSDVAADTRYRGDAFDTALYQERVAGKPRMGGARAVLEHFGFPEPEIRATQYAREKQRLLEELIAAGAWHPFPDALRLVAELRRHHVHLAAASSSKNANDMMRRIPLQTSESAGIGSESPPSRTLMDCFDANVCGRDVEKGKPSPDLFLLAAGELAVSPHECVVVEDAPAGVIAAKSGGMKAIGVARQRDEFILDASGADLVVVSLDEVAVEPLLSGELTSRRRD